MPPDTQFFRHAGDVDFSGNYLFVTSQRYMHRLDESLQPLLEARGGRIVRLLTGVVNKRNLPRGFFAHFAFRAAFTVDCTAPCDLLPSDLPLIAIPHAFWERPQTKVMLEEKPSYLGTADYYLTQDDAQLEQGEVPELRHLRESILYRPGETRHLFWQYLADILRGTVPPQAVAIACEYIGDCCPASRNDELALLLQRLAAGTVERSYNLFREYPFYSELESVYRALHIRRDKGLPCLVRLGQQSDGYQQVEVCPDEAQDMPFLCWGSLRYYGPPGLMHIQKHASQRLAAPTAGCAILLPDRNKELFCQAFTELLVAVYGRPEALSQS